MQRIYMGAWYQMTQLWQNILDTQECIFYTPIN